MTRPDPALDALLAALRGAGLRAGVEEVLRLRHVFSLAPDLDEDGLRRVIAGVLVKSQEDREAFAPVYEAWIQRAREMGEGRAPEGARVEVRAREEGEAASEVGVEKAPLTEAESAPAPRIAEERRPRRTWQWITAAMTSLALVALAFVLSPPGRRWLGQDTGPAAIASGSASVSTIPPPPTSASAVPTARPPDPTARPTTFRADVPHIEAVPRPTPSLGAGTAVLALLAGLAVWMLFGRRLLLSVRAGSAGKAAARGRRGALPAARGPELLDLRDEEAIVWGVGRFVSEDATSQIELDATVEATAEAAGFPDLRFRRARHPREVWLWIDESAEDPALPRLAREVAAALRRAGLPVEEATFWGAPDRLRRPDGAEVTPGELDDRRDAALVAILTDGRLLAGLHASEGERRFLDQLLRGLSHWPRLGVVDFGGGATGMAKLLRRHGIARVAPERLAAFLGAEAEPREARQAVGAPGREEMLWAAACALAPEPVDESLAFALRRRLGGAPSPWGIRALPGAERGAGGRLVWTRGRRAELIRWLVDTERLGMGGEIAPEGALGKALAFWAEVYRDEAAKQGVGWEETAAGRENRARRALVALWTDPEGAAHALYAIWEGELGRTISGHLGWMTAADGGDGAGEEGVVLPWRMADLGFETRAVLEEMGFGKACGVRRVAERRPGRVWAAIGVMVGVMAGVAGGWGVWVREDAREVSGKAPEGVLYRATFQARGAAWSKVVETVHVHEEGKGGPGSDVKVVWAAEPLPCTKVLPDGSEIRRCGKREKPPRPDGWPERSVAVIQASPSEADVDALADALLDSGSVDAVAIGEDWRISACAITQSLWNGTTDQFLVFLPSTQVSLDDLREVCKGRNLGTNAVIVRTGGTETWLELRSRLGFEGTEAAADVWWLPLVAASTKVRLVGTGRPCLEGMVLIPGGTFLMGSKHGDAGEKPEHAVTVDGFCMDLTEVTVGAYKACAKEMKCSDEHINEFSANGIDFRGGELCNYDLEGRSNHPINCVSWAQADTYCKAAGKRLPTEEEWEYGARGGDAELTYPWGSQEPKKQLCWSGKGNDVGTGHQSGTCAVGTYPAGDSRWGAHDMAGNVWEWTSSTYCVPYPDAGVSTCRDSRRVVRGGSWASDKTPFVRGAGRGKDLPARRDDLVGFRCAMTPR